MGPRAPRIAVVMSTYNGEACLAQQLDSVLAQDAPGITVFVRDDGSSDGTVDLLEGYERRGDVVLIRGRNEGVVSSFLDLVAAVPRDFDYISLCDQDDVWHPDKLSRAVGLLEGKDGSIPQLYCSEYYFCDEGMARVGRSHHNRIGVAFPTMLYDNMVSGNTTVINRTLADLVVAAGREGVYTHDWWLGLVASALGELTYDDFASLEYRRTGSNASPTGSGGMRLLRYRIRTFFGKGQLACVTAQLERLHELYAKEMAPGDRELLERFLRGGRLGKVFAPVRLRQTVGGEVALRLLFLFGLL